MGRGGAAPWPPRVGTAESDGTPGEPGGPGVPSTSGSVCLSETRAAGGWAQDVSGAEAHLWVPSARSGVRATGWPGRERPLPSLQRECLPGSPREWI